MPDNLLTNFDPSIPLRVTVPGQGGAPSMLDTAGKMVGVQQEMAQNQILRANIQAQRAMGPILQQSVDPETGEVDWSKATTLMANNPLTAWKAQEFSSLAAQRQLTQAETQKSQWQAAEAQASFYTKQLDFHTNQVNNFMKVIGPLYNDPNVTPQAVRTAAISGVANNLYSAKQAAEYLAGIGDNDSPEVLRQKLLPLVSQSTEALKNLETLRGKVEAINNGGGTRLVRTSPFNAPQDIGGIENVPNVEQRGALVPGKNAQGATTMTPRQNVAPMYGGYGTPVPGTGPQAQPQGPPQIEAGGGLNLGPAPTQPQAQPQAPTAMPWQQFADLTAMRESGGNPTAHNPNSSALGAHQFTKDTWLETIKSAMPDLAKGKTNEQLLELRKDPQVSTQMTQALAQQNGPKLQEAGLPVNATTLALAHRFGPEGAAEILHSGPYTQMEDVVSKKVLEANPELKGKTVGQVVGDFGRTFGDVPVGEAQAQPQPSTLPPAPQTSDQVALQSGSAPPGGTVTSPPESYLGALNASVDNYNKEGKKLFENAVNGIQSLSVMERDLEQLHDTGGFATPGTAIESRLALAKAWNTALQTAGVEDPKYMFNTDSVAAGESFYKESRRAAMQLLTSLFGAQREAATVVEATARSVPAPENSYAGAKLLFASVRNAMDRQIDERNFETNYLRQHGNLIGAHEEFVQSYPPQMYADRAISTAKPFKVDSAEEMKKYLPGTIIMTPGGKKVVPGAYRYPLAGGPTQ